MLSIAIVGTVEVRRDGVRRSIPAGKTTELLVRLALEPGNVVRTERLIDDLWGDASMTTNRNTLQAKVTRLRRALGDPNIVEGVDDGYLLRIDPERVDAFTVLAATAAARALVETGDNRGGAALCREALDAFRNDVLPGAGVGEWATVHRARLDAQRAALLELELRARLNFEAPADLIGDIEAAVATSSYDEGLWSLLITALYRAGRQSDALSTCQRVRRLLADDLGLEPGPALRELEARILRHAPALLPDQPGRDPDELAGNLPVLDVPLVGRDDDVHGILALLRSTRLVEIVGTGGIGKTALAIDVARQVNTSRRDGAWLVRLEGVRSADDVEDTVLTTMNVRGGRTRLRERLRLSDALIIIDNCEHVLDQVAEIVFDVLAAGPNVTVMCTSQVRLGVDGEAVYELGPLALPAAADLFLQRANSHRPVERTPTLTTAAEELCRSLDGLPLAIELAAARTKTLSVQDITRRLDDRFAVLADPTSRRPERRRALRSTIRWSYDLLFPDDQQGLWALAAFADSATIEGVEHVLRSLDVPTSAVLDIIDRLVNRSLLIVDDVPYSAARRYRLLDSIRAFALEMLDDAQRTHVVRAAHAEWYALAADRSTSGVRSADQARHLEVARAERQNIDAAISWAIEHDPPLALRIASGFAWSWVVLGDARGAQRLSAALRATATHERLDAQVQVLLDIGWIEASAGVLDHAQACIDEARAIAESIGDPVLIARCCYCLAYVVSHRGDFQRSIELTDRCRSLLDGLVSLDGLESADRSWDRAANALFAARAAISAGAHARSAESAREVDRSLASVDDPWLDARRQAMHGEFARLEGRFDDAIHAIERAVEISRQRGFEQTEAYQLSCLGRAHAQAGDDTTGAAILRIAITKAAAIGDTRMVTLARVHLGRVLRALGNDDDARAELTTAADWHRRNGGGEQALLGDCLLAAIDLADGRPRSLEIIDTCLATARRTNEPHVEVFALDALARHAADHGRDLDAARLLHEADQRMTLAAHFISERDRVDARAARSEVSQTRW